MHRVNTYPSESDPGLKQFLADMSRYPVLSRQEEAALLKLAKRGSKSAANKLCRHNLRFVFQVALRYRGAGIPFLDMVNVGAMGLLKAVDRFDVKKNLRFLSYAVWWIRAYIIRAINEQGRVVRLSAPHEDEIRKLRAAGDRQTIGGLYVEDIDNTKNLRMTHSYLEANQGAGRAPVSLNHPTSDDCTQNEFLSSDAPLQDEECYTQERIAIMRHLVMGLEERHRKVISLNFGLDGRKPMTLKDIGEIVGLTRERVRQLRNEAMAKIRKRGREYRDE